MSADARRRGHDSWRVYRLQLALGAAGLAASRARAGGRASARSTSSPPAAHRLDVAGLRLTYPTVNAAAVVLMALALLGAAVLLVTVRAAVRQVRAHRRLVRTLPVTGALPGHPSVLVIDAAAPMAFCAGWLRPRVYVSTAVLDRLSEGELRAVLAHEQHHGALRDPLRLAVGRVLCQALFFLPGPAPAARPLRRRRRDHRRRGRARGLGRRGRPAGLGDARARATAGRRGRRHLARARRRPARAAAAPWRPPRLLLVAALATLGALVALVWRASGRASLQATPEPADRLLAALRARPRARAGARLPGRRVARRPAPAWPAAANRRLPAAATAPPTSISACRYLLRHVVLRVVVDHSRTSREPALEPNNV